MSKPVRKITVNVPEALLDFVRGTIGMGTTEAVIEGLRELEKREKRRALKSLKGKISFELNLEKTRK